VATIKVPTLVEYTHMTKPATCKGIHSKGNPREMPQFCVTC